MRTIKSRAASIALGILAAVFGLCAQSQSFPDPVFPFGAVYFRKSNPPEQDWERDHKTAADMGMNIFRHWFMWASIENSPGFVAAYAGDTLWATAAFLGVGLVLPGASTKQVAALAMTVSVAVEVSQLYHAPWIDAVRRTTVGGLALGSGFVWSDLACYAVGVGLGILVERAGLKNRPFPTRSCSTSKTPGAPG